MVYCVKANSEVTHLVLLFQAVGTVMNYLYTTGSLLYLANTVCQLLLT
jgi:hypothetical protein